MVVLCDEKTASDGEAFAEGFRRLELGKLIGTRTWGGEIWLTLATSWSTAASRPRPSSGCTARRASG